MELLECGENIDQLQKGRPAWDGAKTFTEVIYRCEMMITGEERDILEGPLRKQYVEIFKSQEKKCRDHPRWLCLLTIRNITSLLSAYGQTATRSINV